MKIKFTRRNITCNWILPTWKICSFNCNFLCRYINNFIFNFISSSRKYIFILIISSNILSICTIYISLLLFRKWYSKTIWFVSRYFKERKACFKIACFFILKKQKKLKLINFFLLHFYNSHIICCSRFS